MTRERLEVLEKAGWDWREEGEAEEIFALAHRGLDAKENEDAGERLRRDIMATGREVSPLLSTTDQIAVRAISIAFENRALRRACDVAREYRRIQAQLDSDRGVAHSDWLRLKDLREALDAALAEVVE